MHPAQGKLRMVHKNDGGWDSTVICDEAKHQQEEVFSCVEDLHFNMEEVHAKLNAKSADANSKFLLKESADVENFPVQADPRSQICPSSISAAECSEDTISCTDGEPLPRHVGTRNMMTKRLAAPVRSFQSSLESVHEERNRGLKFSSDKKNILPKSSKSFTSTINPGIRPAQKHMQSDRCQSYDSFTIPSPEPAPKCELQSSVARRPCVTWKNVCESSAKRLTRQKSSPIVRSGCGSGMVQRQLSAPTLGLQSLQFQRHFVRDSTVGTNASASSEMYRSCQIHRENPM